MNYLYAATILLISLRRHVRKHRDTRGNACHHDSTTLSINKIREEIIEHALEDTFQIDRSSPLVRKESNLSHQ